MEKKGKPSRLLKKSNLSFLVQMVGEEYWPLMAETDDVQVISDLYVCAYDHIPPEKLWDALHADDPHQALVSVRRQYLHDQDMVVHPSKNEPVMPDKAEKASAAENTAVLPKPKDEIQELLDRIMEPGKYSSDQVDYLLTCIEDGVDPAIIREIACPDYPVDVIRKLRNIKERRRANQEGGG